MYVCHTLKCLQESLLIKVTVQISNRKQYMYMIKDNSMTYSWRKVSRAHNGRHVWDKSNDVEIYDPTPSRNCVVNATKTDDICFGNLYVSSILYQLKRNHKSFFLSVFFRERLVSSYACILLILHKAVCGNLHYN